MSGCTCGCCGGLGPQVPASTENRPGLPALRYRIGTHAAFLAEMRARLSSPAHPALADLKTRRPDDPAIALLDAWAVVADVLTFYQERIANEGYLGTATERRSIVELGRLVGYEPRPGVAATTYLAYSLDEDRSVTPPRPSAVTIPAGSRAQSVPGPGELPQSFETAEDLEARSSWNNLQVRRTRPQTRETVAAQGLFLKGVATGLKVHDPLLINFGVDGVAAYRITSVTLHPPDWTCVRLKSWITRSEVRAELAAIVAWVKKEGISGPTVDELIEVATNVDQKAFKEALRRLEALLKDTGLPATLLALLQDLDVRVAWLQDAAVWPNLLEPFSAPPPTLLDDPLDVLPQLATPPSLPPSHGTRLPRDVATQLGGSRDTLSQLLISTRPSVRDGLYSALRTASTTAPAVLEVYRMTPSALFGHNAAPKPLKFSRGVITAQEDWHVVERDRFERIQAHEEASVVNLEGVHDEVVPGTWLLVETLKTPRTEPALKLVKAGTVAVGIGRSEYGMSGKTTRVRLAAAADGGAAPTWIAIDDKEITDDGNWKPKEDFDAIRKTVVYIQGPALETVEAPIEEPIGNCPTTDPATIELADLYDGLESGRWVVVSGERIVPGTSGVPGVELAMLEGVEQRPDSSIPGDKVHSFLTLAQELAYCYKRETVVVYGNVVKATQGETRSEVLGGGDPSKPFQRFTLRQPPLTFVPAPTARGAASTLTVRVDGLRWHERERLTGAGPTDHVYVTRTDDNGKTTVVFGSGERGARPPTGQENIGAVYRSGMGKAGNVGVDRITLLASRPLGVRAVTNPVRASGGADRETRDQARRNVPLSVLALDRLVSTQDYADFATAFAGIGKASAARLTLGGQQVVHVTIAGIDDLPIEPTSDLYRNLVLAERELGDPDLPLSIEVRELVALVLSARVRVLPDYLFELVAPKIRARLLEAFGFDRRDLGQSVFSSEVVAAMQGVEGVAWVDLDVLQGISETELSNPDAVADKLKAGQAALPKPVVGARLAEPDHGVILPAQLAVFVPAVPDTIVLNEVLDER